MMNHPLFRMVMSVLSFAALVGIVIPVTLFSFNKISLDSMKIWLFVSTAVWFFATPFWMDRGKTLERMEENEKTF